MLKDAYSNQNGSIDNRVVAGSSPAVGVAADVAQLVEHVHTTKSILKKGLHDVEAFMFPKIFTKM